MSSGSGLSKEGRRKARASAHAKHGRTCECGKVLHGNGWRSHARICRDYLRKHGWEFADWEREILMDSFREYINDVHERVSALRKAQLDEAVSRGLITREEIILQDGA